MIQKKEKISLLHTFGKHLRKKEEDRADPDMECLINEYIHFGDNQQSNHTYTYLADHSGIHFDNSYFYVVAFQFQLPQLHTMKSPYDTHQMVQNYINEIATDTLHEPVWFYRMNHMTTLMLLNTSETSQTIDTLVQKLQKELQKEYHIESIWGISLSCRNPDELYVASEQAINAVRTATSKQPHVSHYSLKDEGTSLYYPDSIANLLIYSIKNNNPDAIDCIIHVIRDENFIVRSNCSNKLGTLNAKIINSLYRLNSQNQSFLDLFVALNQCIINNNDRDADSNCEYQDYFDQLAKICHSIRIQMNKRKTTQKISMIQQITQYINDHYADPCLGLAMVASQFQISEGYLSSIFKEHTNLNFTDYVEHLRIDAACSQLSSTDDAISRISEQVGYNSVYSFRRAFKRSTNMGPSEYRALHSNQ